MDGIKQALTALQVHAVSTAAATARFVRRTIGDHQVAVRGNLSIELGIGQSIGGAASLASGDNRILFPRTQIFRPEDGELGEPRIRLDDNLVRTGKRISRKIHVHSHRSRPISA